MVTLKDIQKGCIRSALLERAKNDFKLWCVGPDAMVNTVSGQRHSDQFWLREFCKETAKDLGSVKVLQFLSTFRLTNRTRWNGTRTARIIKCVSKTKSFCPKRQVPLLAKKLKNHRGEQLSAAGKIGVFARPKEEVFIWDRFA